MTKDKTKKDLKKFLEQQQFEKRKPPPGPGPVPGSVLRIQKEAKKPRDKRKPISDLLSGMRRYYRGGKV